MLSINLRALTISIAILPTREKQEGIGEGDVNASPVMTEEKMETLNLPTWFTPSSCYEVLYLLSLL